MRHIHMWVKHSQTCFHDLRDRDQNLELKTIAPKFFKLFRSPCIYRKLIHFHENGFIYNLIYYVSNLSIKVSL